MAGMRKKTVRNQWNVGRIIGRFEDWQIGRFREFRNLAIYQSANLPMVLSLRPRAAIYRHWLRARVVESAEDHLTRRGLQYARHDDVNRLANHRARVIDDHHR